MRAFSLVILLIPACGGGGSSPKMGAPCNVDTDCTGGFICTQSLKCALTCKNTGGMADDTLCTIGYVCDTKSYNCGVATDCDPGAGNADCNGYLCDPATMHCNLGAQCFTDDDCGTYHCDLNAGCYTSCEDFTECGSNYMCDSITHRCM